MNPVKVMDVLPTDSFDTVAGKVSLHPDAILILLGGCDAAMTPGVRSLCARALAPVAAVANALIVDDGSSDGLAAQMGVAAQQLDVAPSLLGILSPGAGQPDPNHENIVQLPAAWGDPDKSRFLLIAALSKNGAAAEKPVIAVLFGGTGDDIISLLRCARRGWPIFIVAGAGGLGDMLLAASAVAADGIAPPVVDDPDMREILDIGTLFSLPLAGEVEDLKRILLGPMERPGDVLLAAWSQYDDLDRAAVGRQRKFRSLQMAILSFGVLAALLAVLSVVPRPYWLFSRVPAIVGHDLRRLVRGLLIVVPIAISVITSFNSRFREGNKWILLRAAAESIKREIFRYRTRSGEYSGLCCGQTSAQLKLAASIKDITANLAQTEVNRSNLPHQPKIDPASVTFLRPEDYLIQRIDDQAGYFVGKTAALYTRLKRLQLSSLVVGGLGTFLAAVNLGVWVAVTTALASAFITKLELEQVENSLVQYNVALASLRNVDSWWKALTPWEKARQRNIDLLVDQTEKALQLETAGWVQQMQSELDKLTEKQAAPDRGVDAGK